MMGINKKLLMELSKLNKLQKYIFSGKNGLHYEEC